MGAIRMLVAPIRSVVSFPLFQLAAVVVVILLLEGAAEFTLLGQIYKALDRIVDYSVRTVSTLFNIKSFTRAWLATSFWIGYVYLAGLVILALLRLVVRLALDVAGRWNLFWLRDAIARERGIAAYRAWEPLESIRPDDIPQAKWEETFAWPANNRPPYPPLWQRLARAVLGYVVVFLAAAGAVQYFTPFPILTWLGDLAKVLAKAI
ncbi:MAG: hypothetical protein NTV97_17000 [Alphaproteobacteria bacterium]|nr:hypothetical protein [Alphaproteobacteria bacterium]